MCICTNMKICNLIHIHIHIHTSVFTYMHQYEYVDRRISQSPFS